MLPTPREADWQFPRAPRTGPRARRLLRAQLAKWKVDDETAATAELVLSELVANAVRHARIPQDREIGIRIIRTEHRLRLEVADADNTRPKTRQAAPDDEQGRGLTLIDALSSRWGCDPRPYGIGKTVWSELDLADEP